MNKLIFACIAVFSYKILSNLISFLKIKKYEKEFLEYLSDKPSKIEECKLQTIALLKKAGVKDKQTPITQPSGYGQIVSFNASVFQNFPSKMLIIAGPAMDMFKNAAGIYKSRIYECFNPIYWIDLVIFLPKNLLIYVGLNPEKSAFKLWNVFLTFIWWTFCTLIGFFQPEIKNFLVKMFA